MTGDACGVGHGIAVCCTRAGADVPIFDTKPEMAVETADLVREEGGKAEVYEASVTDTEGIETAADAVIDSFGDIHGLVNNADVQWAAPLLETTEDDWDLRSEVDTKGAFLVPKVVTSRMIDGDIEGNIVNISSVGAERPLSGQGVYGTSKAAVLVFTTVLAKELSDHDITVNVPRLGTVEAPMVGE